MIVKLINMPFGSLVMPSIGLTQLKYVTDEQFTDKVSTSIHYASIDFASQLPNVSEYNQPHSSTGFITGSGDWIFSKCAFPSAKNRTEEYLARYYFENDQSTTDMRESIQRMTEIAPSFLDEVIEKYELHKADVVGFSLLFFQTTASIALANRIKQRNANVIIVAGGSACEGISGQELARTIDSFDYVFSGGGLISFPQLISHLLEGRRELCDIIDGVFSQTNQTDKSKADAIAMVGQERDINNLVNLDYNSFLDHIHSALPGVSPALSFETSRGCWWGEKRPCSFCGLNGTRLQYSAMSPDNASKYIKSVLSCSDRASFFIAVDNCMPENYPTDVLAHINTPKNTAIRYEVKPTVTKEELSILSAARVLSVQPGIEALSNASLDLMNKGTTALRNIEFLRDCSELNIKAEWNLLIASPGESEEVYESYLDLMPKLYHLEPPESAFPIMYVRHSRYFNHSEKFGLDLVPQDFNNFIFPFDDEVVARLSNFFVNKNDDHDKIESWLSKLNTAIDRWKELHSNGTTTARLTIEKDDGAYSILDSRSGTLIEHSLIPIMAKIILSAMTPLTREDINSLLPDTAEADIAKAIRYLTAHNILLNMDDQYLSLATTVD